MFSVTDLLGEQEKGDATARTRVVVLSKSSREILVEIDCRLGTIKRETLRTTFHGLRQGVKSVKESLHKKKYAP